LNIVAILNQAQMVMVMVMVKALTYKPTSFHFLGEPWVSF